MAANNKRKYIIWGSVLTILGVGGYFAYTYFKGKGGNKSGGSNDGSNDDKSSSQSSSSTSTQSTSSTTKPSTPAYVPTKEEVALAVAYRTWANSTDELAKKYGKPSKYDLDATSTNPYGGTFKRSYAAGKAEYEEYLKSKPVYGADSGTKQKNQITAMAAAYGVPIKASTDKGQYVQLPFNATRGGIKNNYYLQVYEKNNTGYNPDGESCLFIIWERQAKVQIGYEDIGLFEIPKYQQQGDWKSIVSGWLTYKNGIFKGTSNWAQSPLKTGTGNHAKPVEFCISVTNGAIYGPWV